MHNFGLNDDGEVTTPQPTTAQLTARWTATAYAVGFGQVEQVPQLSEEQQAFQVSAWGVSAILRELLGDYSNMQVRASAEWLTLQQNQLVSEMLMMSQIDWFREHEPAPPLENMFFSVDTELFLPHGMMMHVTCVTNIVPRGEADDGLDKFVAILEPSEVTAYIAERKSHGMAWHNEWLQ